MYYYDLTYYGIILLSAILGGATQLYINSMYRKWSKVQGSTGGTGAQVARQMLDTSGAGAVGITHVSGHLTDYYDPRDNNLHLSDENFNGGSVASVAVACHEAGHAVQTAKGYLPGRIRTAIVPVVSISQQAWSIVFMLGIIMNIAGFVELAVLLFAFTVVFHLVTLPVEIDASRRAVAYLGRVGGVDQKGARQVLIAAALTYVASALMSIMQLVYLLGRTNNRRR